MDLPNVELVWCGERYSRVVPVLVVEYHHNGVLYHLALMDLARLLRDSSVHISPTTKAHISNPYIETSFDTKCKAYNLADAGTLGCGERLPNGTAISVCGHPVFLYLAPG